MSDTTCKANYTHFDIVARKDVLSKDLKVAEMYVAYGILRAMWKRDK